MDSIEPEEILEKNARFKSSFGIDLIREDAKILLLLKKHGGLSAKDLIYQTQLSYRAFYIKMKFFIDSGVVHAKEGSTDRRVRIFYINETCARAGVDRRTNC
ncbi:MULTISPECIES: hypothetical protein [Sphingobium]|nr:MULTISPECIES: hypothetical protein [Sphingobium]